MYHWFENGSYDKLVLWGLKEEGRGSLCRKNLQQSTDTLYQLIVSPKFAKKFKLEGNQMTQSIDALLEAQAQVVMGNQSTDVTHQSIDHPLKFQGLLMKTIS